MADEVEAEKEREDSFFAISPFMIFPEAYGNFSVYLKKGRHFLLYTHKGEQFTERHKETLYEHGVDELYIHTSQKLDYDEYVQQNLGGVLSNESIPLPVRSKVFYHSSTSAIKEIVRSRLPTTASAQLLGRLTGIVEASLRFICSKDALKTVASLMSHDYDTYTHSSNVFIYTAAIVETYYKRESEKIQCGLGALLHDIGKVHIPKKILNKAGKLNATEWEIIKTHPVKGVGMCAHIALEQSAINAVLFHHEKCDGKGYPAGLTKPYIPLPAKIVSVADVYDALTSKRPYAEAMTPFKALSVMREEMESAFDPDVFKRFVLVLSGAGIA
ncbi:MAG: HD domain-containing phosphohydrolase [Syntrophobacteraceae bacterium]|nr:HD domain-containing protein [Desulfobacteraceae bacterium]